MKFLCSQNQDKLWLLDGSCGSIDKSNSTTISGEEILKAFKYMCQSYTTKVEKVYTQSWSLKWGTFSYFVSNSQSLSEWMLFGFNSCLGRGGSEGIKGTID